MTLLTWYRERVRLRTDGEHHQALVRVVILSVLLLYTAWIGAASPGVAPVLWTINLSSVAFSILLLAHLLHRPAPSPFRRVVGALHDNVATTLYLYNSGPMGALALFVYSFVTVGNGFRYGVSYLAASGVVGACGMGFLVFAAPGWTSFGMIGASVLLTHVVVTIYTGALLRRLHETQDELERLATCDALTGLPNRRFFMERLREMAAMRDRLNIAVIYLDLDGFKTVNDSLGHRAGDELLVQVAHRLRSATRGSDTVARLGGDEFTVLLDAPLGPAAAHIVAARIIASIEKIQSIGGLPVRVSASIGLSFAAAGTPASSATLAEELLRTADEAMYVAKRSGKGRCQLVDLAGMVLAHAA